MYTGIEASHFVRVNKGISEKVADCIMKSVRTHSESPREDLHNVAIRLFESFRRFYEDPNTMYFAPETNQRDNIEQIRKVMDGFKSALYKALEKGTKSSVNEVEGYLGYILGLERDFWVKLVFFTKTDFPDYMANFTANNVVPLRVANDR